MFTKLLYRINTDAILRGQFHYDPDQFPPWQRRLYRKHVKACFAARKRPAAAASFFMLSQADRNRCGGITYKFCARVETMSSVAD